MKMILYIKNFIRSLYQKASILIGLYQQAMILQKSAKSCLAYPLGWTRSIPLGIGNTNPSHIRLVQLLGLLPRLHLGTRARHINSCRPKGPKSIANSIITSFILIFFSYPFPAISQNKPGNKTQANPVIFQQESTEVLTFERALDELKSIHKTYNQVQSNPKLSPKERDEKNNDIKNRAKALFNSLVDIDFTGRLSLGKYWQKLNETKKKNFIQNFRTIIENKLSTGKSKTKKKKELVKKKVPSKLNTIQQIRITNNDLFFDRIFFKKKVTRILTIVPGQEVDTNVDFLMIRDKDKFIIYDVNIDDDSVVNGYRNQFMRIIRKNGLNGLMKKLAKKAKTIRRKDG